MAITERLTATSATTYGSFLERRDGTLESLPFLLTLFRSYLDEFVLSEVLPEVTQWPENVPQAQRTLDAFLRQIGRTLYVAAEDLPLDSGRLIQLLDSENFLIVVEKIAEKIPELTMFCSLLSPTLPSSEKARLIRCWMRDVSHEEALKKVCYLDLRGLGLTSLPHDICLLPNLEHLDISHNQITELPSLDGLTKLYHLDVSHNLLTELPDLSALTRLHALIADHNRLSSLPSLEGLLILERLHVSHNNLREMPSTLNKPPYLHDLRLGNNPHLILTDETKNLIRDRIYYANPGAFAKIDFYLESTEADPACLRLHEALVNFNNRFRYALSQEPDLSPEQTAVHQAVADHKVHPGIQEEQETVFFSALWSLLNIVKDISPKRLAKEPFYPLIERAWNNVPESHRHEVYEWVWRLNGAPAGDFFWGEHHVFDSPAILEKAIRCAILWKCIKGQPLAEIKEAVEALSEEDRHHVYEWVWKISGEPRTYDHEWGRHHAFDNLTILYRALRSTLLWKATFHNT